MTRADKAAWQRLMDRTSKLRADVRDRVVERAAILIYQAGLDPDEADERAMAEEAGIATQKELVA